ncbi:MAG: ArsR family transcriptional regulator [Candidatus Altiarchaeota archaeon]
MEQLLIRNLEEPFNREVLNEINWICESFGFFEKIDKQKTVSSIFTQILEKSRLGKGITSTELTEELQLSRVAVLNHLKKLINAGLITQNGNEYQLRSQNLYRTVREMKRDVKRSFEDVERIAKEIDISMGLKRVWKEPEKIDTLDKQLFNPYVGAERN